MLLNELLTLDARILKLISHFFSSYLGGRVHKQLGIVVWLTNIGDAFFAPFDDLFEK